MQISQTSNLFRLRFRIYLFLNGGLVLAVMGLFASIPEKQVAALFAGSLFILSPVLILGNEIRLVRKAGLGVLSWACAIGCLQFLLLSALPVFLLRVLNWGIAFDALSIAGVSGPVLHKLSNYSFLLMLVCFAFESVKKNKTPSR